MPLWLVTLLTELPSIIAEINAIVAAIQNQNGVATNTQLAALSRNHAAVDGINQALGFHLTVS